MFNKDLKTCVTLINRAIKETLDRWAGTTELSIYAWGYLDFHEGSFTVGSNRHTVFYYLHDVVSICEACECDYYLCLAENHCGEMTPAIHIY